MISFSKMSSVNFDRIHRERDREEREELMYSASGIEALDPEAFMVRTRSAMENIIDGLKKQLRERSSS